MSKKKIGGFVGISLLIAVGLLFAQDRSRGPGAGGPMGQWLDDLDKAYQQKNNGQNR
jgi:hypothetical protein